MAKIYEPWKEIAIEHKEPSLFEAYLFDVGRSTDSTALMALRAAVLTDASLDDFERRILDGEIKQKFEDLKTLAVTG